LRGKRGGEKEKIELYPDWEEVYNNNKAKKGSFLAHKPPPQKNKQK